MNVNSAEAAIGKKPFAAMSVVVAKVFGWAKQMILACRMSAGVSLAGAKRYRLEFR